MTETAAFRRVYWAGAAIALMADVELRMRSRRTLDDALADLFACCAHDIAPISADEAIAHMDRSGPPVFGPIARRVLGDRRVPDLARTYEALGIEVGPDGPRFGGDEQARALRDSIMARRELAPPPPSCGR
jgi:predicted metalloprotease with PDZ domain